MKQMHIGKYLLSYNSGFKEEAFDNKMVLI